MCKSVRDQYLSRTRFVFVLTFGQQDACSLAHAVSHYSMHDFLSDLARIQRRHSPDSFRYEVRCILPLSVTCTRCGENSRKTPQCINEEDGEVTFEKELKVTVTLG